MIIGNNEVGVWITSRKTNPVALGRALASMAYGKSLAGMSFAGAVHEHLKEVARRIDSVARLSQADTVEITIDRITFDVQRGSLLMPVVGETTVTQNTIRKKLYVSNENLTYHIVVHTEGHVKQLFYDHLIHQYAVLGRLERNSNIDPRHIDEAYDILKSRLSYAVLLPFQEWDIRKGKMVIGRCSPHIIPYSNAKEPDAAQLGLLTWNYDVVATANAIALQLAKEIADRNEDASQDDVTDSDAFDDFQDSLQKHLKDAASTDTVQSLVNHKATRVISLRDEPTKLTPVSEDVRDDLLNEPYEFSHLLPICIDHINNDGERLAGQAAVLSVERVLTEFSHLSAGKTWNTDLIPGSAMDLDNQLLALDNIRMLLTGSCSVLDSLTADAVKDKLASLRSVWTSNLLLAADFKNGTTPAVWSRRFRANRPASFEDEVMEASAKLIALTHLPLTGGAERLSPSPFLSLVAMHLPLLNFTRKVTRT